MQDQPSLLDPNAPENHSKKPSKTPDPWKSQLSTQVERAFHSLNTYGKSPDTLGGIFLDFSDALKGHAMVDIDLAFKEWKKSKESFPTPAEILKLTEHFKIIRSKANGVHIKKSWLQVIRDEFTDEILAEYSWPQNGISQVEVFTKYGANAKTSFRQE